MCAEAVVWDYEVKMEDYIPQMRYIAPQVKPAPKAVSTILSPFFSLSLFSSRHKGIDAALVLPRYWMFTSTLSGLMPRRSPTASMIRKFA